MARKGLARGWFCVLLSMGILTGLAVPGNAEDVGILPGGSIGLPAGLGGFDFLAADPSAGLSGAAWSLTESSYNLGDIDPFTGQFTGGDVTAALSPQASAEADLVAADALAFDVARAQEAARAQAAAQKAAMAAKRLTVALTAYTNAGTPAPWQLTNFSTCGDPNNATFQARIETVNAFEVACQAAAQAGVALRIDSAFRDPAKQKELYDAAVIKYGSADAARRWVAYSDGSGCSSRHCAGIAIDIDQGNGTGDWMYATVGCLSGGTPTLGPTQCPGGQIPITRIQRYGLIPTIPNEPWHFELGIPVDAAGGGATPASCSPPANYTVPQTIAAVFRCQLANAGLTSDQVRQHTAEALVVSKCESGWNANAVAFGGRYTTSPNPSTGLRYTAAGVFQFIDTTADQWIDGGYAQVNDPVANVNGAARLWLDGYKRDPANAWRPWACAAVNDGFAKASVLPGYPGGPADLPSWSLDY